MLCRSIVSGLLRQGCEVLVVSASPTVEDVQVLSGAKNTHVPADLRHERLTVVVLPVPASKWRRLDRQSAWEEMGSAAEGARVQGAVSAFGARSVVAVDWSTRAVYHTLRQSGAIADLPLIYMVFRVFSASQELHHQEEDAVFYRVQERHMLDASLQNVLLNQRDRRELSRLQAVEERLHEESWTVLYPPLRDDMAALATAGDGQPPPRSFLTCNARLSPEKNAMLFAAVVETLGEERLQSLGLIPVLCGAACVEAYAKSVRDRVRAAFPGGGSTLRTI